MSTTILKDRKYFIDYLRIILIVSVFFYHIGMIFNVWGWHIKSESTFAFLSPIMSFLSLWRMPLLFLVSGAGTYFALGRRSTGGYLKERTRRLFLPFIAGIFLLVPVQVYIENYSSYDSLLQFYPHMFEGIYPEGNFSWHHLWFLIYLYFISLVFAPFLRVLKKQIEKGAMSKFFSGRARMNLIILILILSQVILRPYFPDNTHAFFNDWAFFSMYLIYFITGFVLVSQEGITDALKRDRRIYLFQTIVFITLFLVLRSMDGVNDYLFGTVEIVLAWSCGMAALGYAKKYLNQEHGIRKALNEAIYPFYLLHQPIIILVGFYWLKLSLTPLINAVVITVLSFTSIIFIYRFIIYPSAILRPLFGLKSKLAPKRKDNEEYKIVTEKIG